MTEVIDGQTFSVVLRSFVDGHSDSKKNESRPKNRVRLASIAVPGIDSPLGQIAKNNLEKLILRRDVQLQFFCAAKSATVTYEEFDVGPEQIRAGLAQYEGGADAQEYAKCNDRFAEAKAKSERLGIWQ